MQIEQPWCWLKKGRQRSKSTYHFSTPRTVRLAGDSASGGQASSQTRQDWQKPSMPCSAGPVGAKGASVITAPRRKFDPCSGLMIEPCLPSSPKPAASAGGISVIAPVIGPVTGSASQPWPRSHPATILAAAAARRYWRVTSLPAGRPGAVVMRS